ncbi:alkylated DNA repair protein alkB homolog 8 isoform X1 [Stegostoma tigrinum]|uniref:alkylated DNA repair protein alkB homolog 8 isoform X1 n=1 Tax=Stegostoma tigrinum TaxID=3053191 RepID=UPI002870B1AE|nr:alkylated DNA repair protein alkB homolog 8 isoform X1 [Stegostoma tigrinum]
MAAPDCRSVKLSKGQKKLLRKQAKAQHILLKQDGIATVSIPTKHLVIANGGLGNGVSREQLNVVLQKFGTVETLLMLPHKPHAFVTYTAIQEAKEAYSALNGQNLKSSENTKLATLYLNFVEDVVSEDVFHSSLPPGLLVIEDFISAEYEKRLLVFADESSNATMENAQKSLKHRRVKHYGYEFRYDNNNVDKDKPLPGGLPEICSEVLEQSMTEGYIKFKPDQLTINQYEPGQGIPPHIDTHSAFEDGIICLSLGAETVMDFKHPNGHSVAVMLPRCSLLVMTGESRYLWSHGITPRKFDVVSASEIQKTCTITEDISNLTLNKRGARTSFTFRKVRTTLCDCAYPEVCDSQSTRKCKDTPTLVPNSDGDASKLEHKYVHDVYDEIAGHFSSTRHTPWPKVTEFLKALPAGAFVADVGCGNGKYLGVNKDLFMVGCDHSKSLAHICRERNFEVFICDGLLVPLRGGVCDACISIAVVHHFSTEGRRLSAIKEIVRLLRPGGKGLIYVWAMEQERDNIKSKYLMERKKTNKRQNCTTMPIVNEDQDTNRVDLAHFSQLEDHNKDIENEQNCAKLPVHTNRTSFESQDLLVPWHLKAGVKVDSASSLPPTGPKNITVFHRYYHVFSAGELENLCSCIPNTRIVESYYDQGNWCVIIEKH